MTPLELLFKIEQYILKLGYQNCTSFDDNNYLVPSYKKDDSEINMAWHVIYENEADDDGPVLYRFYVIQHLPTQRIEYMCDPAEFDFKKLKKLIKKR